MLFQGKTAIVTGAASGIGRATVEKLLKNGAKKVICADLCNYYTFENQYNNKFIKRQLNVGDKHSIESFYSQARNDLNNRAPDLLVNNAGITRDSKFSRMTDEQWHEMIKVNLDSIFYMTKNYVNWVEESKELHKTDDSSLINNPRAIVNLSSISAKVGNFGQANYCAAKAGVYGITKNNARELASLNLRVNAVSPGFIATAMTAAMPPKVLKGVLMTVPMQRAGLPEEIADSILFLGSEQSSYVTGINLEVAGGLGM